MSKVHPDKELDLVRHLLPLPMGPLLKSLQEADPDREYYGDIPYLYEAVGADCCASSFAERVNSVGKDVLTPAKSMYKDQTVERLTALRMNAEFIEHMKSHHGHAVGLAMSESVIRKVMATFPAKS